MNDRNAGWLMRSTGGAAQITVHHTCQSLIIISQTCTWVLCHPILIVDDISPHFILRTLFKWYPLTIAVGALSQSFDRVSFVLVFHSVEKVTFYSANDSADKGEQELGVCLVARKSHTGLVILHVRKIGVLERREKRKVRVLVVSVADN